MQNAAHQGSPAPAGASTSGVQSIISDLMTLAEHVHGAIAAIEAEIAREHSISGLESGPNVIVLDDVTPRYAKASAALSACRVNLKAALQVLADSQGSARSSVR